MHIYYAAPLFSHAEQQYNTFLVQKIREHYPNLTLYAPQENEAINDKTAYADSKMIAKADTDEVLASDLMIAVLDGLVIDPGVASEIGVAYAKGIPVIGLYTDSRQQGGQHPQKIAALQEIAENQFHYLNLYTTGLIKLNGTIVNSEAALLTAIADYVRE
ncbi:hypothetical protein RU97_GL000022 [Enterococcus canis]|uniref:Nucleoside 2-deoxyribosyltransferase n=1 Tax=Enterococcus canis TaxID=214095 RepID=A0A1L8RJ51_9ENTE|nr:nucleoside 2-deoxyribosyltransferase [Enterococcus canis]OJG19789.1 hypothetical protein RU97_GL000022 [Enterococcus canis]